MKLFIEIRPNSFNESCCHIVLYKGWKWFKWEIGRLDDERKIKKFIDCHQRLDGQEIDI